MIIRRCAVVVHHHLWWVRRGPRGTERCRRGECGGGDTPCVRAADDGAQCVLFIY